VAKDRSNRGRQEPKPELIPIGERIARARVAAGLSQSELGKRIDAESQTISKWERGIMAPSAQNLVALAKVLRRSAEWIMEGVEEDGATPPAPRYPDVWREVERLGLPAKWASAGATKIMIEHVMTAPFKGRPSVRDFDRHMHDLLIDADAIVPEPAIRAREERAGEEPLDEEFVKPPRDRG